MPRLTLNNIKTLSRSLATVSESVPKSQTVDAYRAQSFLDHSESENQNKESEIIPRNVAEKIVHRAKKGIEEGKEHFRVGEQKIFFPYARVILLKPYAKYTPYQAQFIVPRTFNKLDFRDYLYHIYGLRALSVRTIVTPGSWKRDTPALPRYRTPQIKKMIIEMEHPFIWPEEPEDLSPWGVGKGKELRKYASDVQRIGSDLLKPPSSFDGALGPYVAAPEPFIPEKVKRQLKNKLSSHDRNVQSEVKNAIIMRYIKDKEAK